MSITPNSITSQEQIQFDLPLPDNYKLRITGTPLKHRLIPPLPAIQWQASLTSEESSKDLVRPSKDGPDSPEAWALLSLTRRKQTDAKQNNLASSENASTSKSSWGNVVSRSRKEDSNSETGDSMSKLALDLVNWTFGVEPSISNGTTEHANGRQPNKPASTTLLSSTQLLSKLSVVHMEGISCRLCARNRARRGFDRFYSTCTVNLPSQEATVWDDVKWTIHYELEENDISPQSAPVCTMKNGKCNDHPAVVENDRIFSVINQRPDDPHKLVRDLGRYLTEIIYNSYLTLKDLEGDEREMRIPLKQRSRHFEHQCELWTTDHKNGSLRPQICTTTRKK